MKDKGKNVHINYTYLVSKLSTGYGVYFKTTIFKTSFFLKRILTHYNK